MFRYIIKLHYSNRLLLEKGWTYKLIEWYSESEDTFSYILPGLIQKEKDTHTLVENAFNCK